MFWLLIKCERCGVCAGRNRRQNTAYQNDELNWVRLCDSCHIENEEYWDDMWAGYYRGRL